MTSSLSDIVGGILTLIGTLIVVFYLSWQVGLVVIFLVPILAYVSDYFSQRVKAASKKARSREGELAAAAQEMLTSIRVMRALAYGLRAIASARAPGTFKSSTKRPRPVSRAASSRRRMAFPRGLDMCSEQRIRPPFAAHEIVKIRNK